MISVYFPICGIVSNLKASTIALYTFDVKLRTLKDNIPLITQLVSQRLLPTITLNAIEETEKQAQDLCSALDSTMKAVAKCPN